jgi:glycerol-3-phosphate dehydrogenase
MWQKGWRSETWSQLDQEWDILVIGGGITGAGVFRRAVAEGYRTLLVEAKDYSFGTSSRSSKLVHGGFRYLRNKQFDVTRESVREREWMLHEARNLVDPLGFLMPCPADPKISSQFALGVVIYDLMAPKWKHRFLSKKQMLKACPELNVEEIKGGFLYFDAKLDDARMVFRMIQESVSNGGCALNYTRVDQLLKTSDGHVCGALISDQTDNHFGDKEVRAKVVINASGPWSDELRAQVNAPARLRKLRGSHLLFPRERLPLPYAVTLLHPRDRRAMFAVPWEGVTLIGTTDLDHSHSLKSGEPFATQQEIEYMLDAGRATFPSANLTHEDVLSTFAGLRPVINTGISDPSKESRAHVVWEENGLITVTGGKLTTFRIMAEQALEMATKNFTHPIDLSKRKTYFEPLPRLSGGGMILSSELAYLSGRYGVETADLMECALPGENEPIENLPNLWVEIRWSARTGAVEHLDDLLLRRVRLGLQIPNGGINLLEKIRQIAQPEMGWSDLKWELEVKRYKLCYEASYSPTPTGF